LQTGEQVKNMEKYGGYNKNSIRCENKNPLLNHMAYCMLKFKKTDAGR